MYFFKTQGIFLARWGYVKSKASAFNLILFFAFVPSCLRVLVPIVPTFPPFPVDAKLHILFSPAQEKPETQPQLFQPLLQTFSSLYVAAS